MNFEPNTSLVAFEDATSHRIILIAQTWTFEIKTTNSQWFCVGAIIILPVIVHNQQSRYPFEKGSKFSLPIEQLTTDTSMVI